MPARRDTPGAKLSNRGGAKNRLTSNRSAKKSKGGRNSSGSRKRLRAASKKKKASVAENRPKPKWAPKNGYYWRKAKSGRWYQKKIDFDPRSKAGFSNPGAGKEWVNKNGLWKRKNIRKVDIRDGQYTKDMAPLAREYNVASRRLEMELGNLPGQEHKADMLRRQWYDRDRADTGASLAARGALHSGGYQNEEIRRVSENSDRVADIADKYGAGARSRLAQQQQDLTSGFHRSKQSLYDQSYSRYAKRNPGSRFIAENMR